LKLGGVEYRTLQAPLHILISYPLFKNTFEVVLLVPYAYRTKTRDMLREARPDGLNREWWAFSSTVTESANSDLKLLNANFMISSGMPYILSIAGAFALDV
jgi:hypothetical protein